MSEMVKIEIGEETKKLLDRFKEKFKRDFPNCSELDYETIIWGLLKENLDYRYG